jgi:hypothetical protein
MIFKLWSKEMMNPDHWNERRGAAKLLSDGYKKLNNYPPVSCDGHEEKRNYHRNC